ncbi:MAG: alpha-L-fucosidase [Halobacteriaceae archaeon]
MADAYEPTWESVDAHAVPDWYHDAKLGIFVHWGVYSVPAWAPTDATLADLEEASPYAEWYPYYMYQEGSPTYEYHREQYGADVEYLDFAEEFGAENWDPTAWAEFFADVGARYVVLTGEHHDGFPLWDSHYARYDAASVGPERDLVGDLCEAVRAEGLRFAASYHANYNYYQPGFDGRFGHPDFEAGGPLESEGGPGSEYVDFMNAKHREIVRKYEPDLLWFDVPKAEGDHLHAPELIADYYNWAAEAGREVVVNNRSATDASGMSMDDEGNLEVDLDSLHGDFATPEYDAFDEITETKWEACRGIGHSFGYNRAETAADHLSAGELVRSFADIVSKNGNLLINVGPRADGTIPDLQREPLEGLGEWLDVNGEAVFGTRPWAAAEDPVAGVEVRYTRKDGDLYATCLEWPGADLSLDVGAHADAGDVAGVELLDGDGGTDLDWRADGDLVVETPTGPPFEAPAYALRLRGVADPRA